MEAKTWELAVEEQHGNWEHCGDYPSLEEAIAEAKAWYPHVYQSDNGTAVFGVSDDPASGHYEHRLEICGDDCVHLIGGAIVGTA